MSFLCHDPWRQKQAKRERKEEEAEGERKREPGRGEEGTTRNDGAT